MKIKTPFRLPVEAEISFDQKECGMLVPKITLKADDLAVHLVQYWRWVSEGKTQYGSRASRGDDTQYFYDSYHDGILYLPETKTYTFTIQIGGGPDGDTWWNGEFTYDGHEIKIIKERYYSN